MKNKLTTKGFTLLEVMVAMAIVAILSVVSIQAYQYNIAKANMVEAVLLIDRLRQEVYLDYQVRQNLPGEVQGAVPDVGTATSQIFNSDTAISMNEKHKVDKYWYFRDVSTQMGWVGVQLKSEYIPDCSGECQLHLGFKEVNNNIEFYCGVWDTATLMEKFPYNLLPQGCQEECVSCRLQTDSQISDLPAVSSNNSGGASSTSGSSFSNDSNVTGGAANTSVGNSSSSNSSSENSSESNASTSSTTQGNQTGQNSSSNSSSGNTAGNSTANNNTGSSNTGSSNTGSNDAENNSTASSGDASSGSENSSSTANANGGAGSPLGSLFGGGGGSSSDNSGFFNQDGDQSQGFFGGLFGGGNSSNGNGRGFWDSLFNNSDDDNADQNNQETERQAREEERSQREREREQRARERQQRERNNSRR